MGIFIIAQRKVTRKTDLLVHTKNTDLNHSQKINSLQFRSIVMTHRLGAILQFYKPFFLWSMAINILIVIFTPYFFPTIITKLLLTCFIWYVFHETNAKRKLIFYKNLGISTWQLFTMLFIFDIIITISFLLIIKAFI